MDDEFIGCKAFDNVAMEKSKIAKFDKQTFEREYIALSGFRTKISNDIKYSLLTYAEKVIDREKARNELFKYVDEPHFVYEIEKGIFEFSLIQVTLNKFQEFLVEHIYNFKLMDLCSNLDVSDKNINNKTLSKMLYSGFTAFMIPFLFYDQLHSERWKSILEKRESIDNIANNMQVSDLYRCSKCHERKCKITEVQIRSLDEPSSKYISCLVCRHTFII